MKLSVIIPSYNSGETLLLLMKSIAGQLGEDDELFVIDDGSTDGSGDRASDSGATVVPTGGRKGPAFARNLGAKNAAGDVLVFLDSDVIAPDHLIGHIRGRFEADPELPALSGLYAPEPANKKFFHYIKAAQCTAWFEGVDSFESLETACCAVRKDIFEKAGGFDERYGGADVEDFEFGYRLGSAIELDHRMAVRHHFPDFWPNTKNYFKRSFQWAKLYGKRRKFDSAATSSQNALATVLAPAWVVIILVGAIVGIAADSWYNFFIGFLIGVPVIGAWKYAKMPVVRELAEHVGWIKAPFAMAHLFVGDLAASAGGALGYLSSRFSGID